MSEQALVAKLDELMAEISRLRAKVAALEAPAKTMPGAAPEAPSGRRRMLKKLAAGLLAGIGGAGLAALPLEAEAKIVTKNGRIGTISTPTGSAATGNLYGSNFSYGLVALSGTGNFDLSNIANIYPADTGIFARGASTGIYSSGSVYGIYGSGPTGVYGNGSAYGVYGFGNIYGVYGNGPTGVYGIGFGGSGSAGVYGDSSSSSVYGVAGRNTGGGLAGFFEGSVQITGTLIKAGGSFKIDHPLDPANSYLSHSFVESPDMLNLYNGIATLNENGCAEVGLPEWFETLNTDYRYQLTPLGQAMPGLYVSREIEGNRFSIAGGVAGGRVSWGVSGIRQDAWARAHRIPVEEAKPERERGHYLHPELYGFGPERAGGFSS